MRTIQKKKRLLCFLLVLAVLSGLLPLQVRASADAEFTARILKVDMETIKKDGITWNGPCGAFALAYCMSIFDGKVHSYSEFWDDNRGAVWSNGGYTSTFPTTKLDGYKRLYYEINAGKPVIAKVNGNPNYHFVTVIGYENVVSVDGLKNSNFLIIDPNDPSRIQNMSDAGYDFKAADNKYQVVYDNKGRQSVGFQKEEKSLPSVVTESYSSYITVTVTNSDGAKVWSMPCSDKTDQNSIHITTLPKGTEVDVLALYKNTAGNYWYKISSSGIDGYIWCNNTAHKRIKENTVIASGGNAYPTVLSKGSYYDVTWKLTSEHLNMTMIQGTITRGSTTRGETLYRPLVSINADTYQLGGSSDPIDMGLLFNKLDAGEYTLDIATRATNYYWDAGSESVKSVESISIPISCVFAVTDSNSKYYLNVNGVLDGALKDGTNDYGTFDVYINGARDANDVTDYYKQWPDGTRYEVNDIKATKGHSYNGVQQDSLSGAVTRYTEVNLSFSTGGESSGKATGGVAGTTIADGVYTLSPQCAPGSHLSLSGAGWSGDGAIIDSANSESSYQKFKLVSSGEGSYVIYEQSCGGQFVLEVPYGSSELETQVILSSYTGVDYQQWILTDAGNGYYNIRPRHDTDLCLDVYFASSADGTRVNVYADNGTNAQKWKLELVAENKGETLSGISSARIEDGYYRLSPECAPKSSLDSIDGSVFEGYSAVINETNERHRAQFFYIEGLSNGYYTFTAVREDLALDLALGGAGAGTDVQFWRSDGRDTQQWSLVALGDGYYNVVPKVDSNLCLDVDNAWSSNGTNVKLWDANGSNAQRWKLTKASYTDPWEDVYFSCQFTYVQGQFSDVHANQWFTGCVADAYELGLMQGSGVDTFNPYGDVTIAEAVTIAARIHSIYYNGTESIPDVFGAWYQKYMDYAYANGVIGPWVYNCDVTQKANRAQIAEIFGCALPESAYRPINSVADNAIPDVSVYDNDAPTIYRLYRAGILTGSDANGTFYAQSYITRAEVAAVISRLVVSDNREFFTLG